jgi:hypothetical protein
LVVLFFLFNFIISSTPSVKAEVDKNQLRMGAYLTFTISVSTALNQNAESLEIKELYEDFDVLSQYQSSSYSSSFINGKFESSHTVHYMYVLTPKSTGLKTIPSLELIIDGETYKTKAIEINVLESRTQSSQQGNDDDNEKEDKTLIKPNNLKGKNNFYQFDVKAMADKTDVYLGEQITVTYYLLSKVSLDNPDIYKRPEFKGFIKEDLENVSRLDFKKQIIDGETYNVALLSKYALYPLREGVLYIDSLAFRANVLSEDTFGSGFFRFSRPRQSTRESETIKVNVKKVPDKDKPLNFSGAVGSFEINSNLSSSDIRTGIPFSFFVKLRGRGNLQAIDRLNIKFSESLELFEVKQSYSISSLGFGEKIFEYVLIPRQEGQHQIFEYVFSFFNPNTKKYEFISIEDIIFNSKGTLTGAFVKLNQTPNLKEKSIILNQDIRFIDSDLSFKNFNIVLNNIYYYILYLVLIFVFIILVFKMVFNNNNAKNIETYIKNSNASFKKGLKSNDLEESLKFYIEAIINIISFKVNMNKYSDKYEDILEKYSDLIKDRVLIDEIKEFINISYALRYKKSKENISKDYLTSKVKKILKKLLT